MPMMIVVTSGRIPLMCKGKGNEVRTEAPMGRVPCYTFCDTAALLLRRFTRPMRFALDARRPHYIGLSRIGEVAEWLKAAVC